MTVPAVAARYFADAPFPPVGPPLITGRFSPSHGDWEGATGQPVTHAALVALRRQGFTEVTLTAAGRSADFRLSELVGTMRPVDAALADGDDVPPVLDAQLVRLSLFGALESEHHVEVHAGEPGWALAVCRTHGTAHLTRCRDYAT